MIYFGDYYVLTDYRAKGFSHPLNHILAMPEGEHSFLRWRSSTSLMAAFPEGVCEFAKLTRVNVHSCVESTSCLATAS